MKITNLEIQKFRHLKNLTFDFTYQTGAKKGQPLEKICFIGQSATGKTSILEYIKSFIDDRDNVKLNIKNSISILIDNDILNLNKSMNIPEREHVKSFGRFYKRKLFYFSSDQLSPNNFKNISKNLVESNPIDLAFKILTKESEISKNNKFKDLSNKRIYEFDFETNKDIWDYILDEISVYRTKSNQKGSDLINFKSTSVTSMIKEIELWKKNNPNPLENLAIKCLNPILKKLNLEVDLVDVSYPIPLKPINSEAAIPSNALSTGTKQLMLNALPLYKLDTANSIVIIDEPERSLFPDIQMELISFYQNLSPNAQFIVATHSPFIAASFEPDERFILYFDEQGNVKYKNGVAPIGDDPNDILKNDFGVRLMNDFGLKAFEKYRALKQKMSTEKNTNIRSQLLKEVVALGDEYNFNEKN